MEDGRYKFKVSTPIARPARHGPPMGHRQLLNQVAFPFTVAVANLTIAAGSLGLTITHTHNTASAIVQAVIPSLSILCRNRPVGVKCA